MLLKAGDVLIQRGTNHAWSNRTDAPAYVAFVLAPLAGAIERQRGSPMPVERFAPSQLLAVRF